MTQIRIDQDAIRVFGEGLRFPEGPVADKDGSVIVPEIEGAALVRIRPGGELETIAEVGGGANGVAFGPDGALYVTNDGGYLFTDLDGARVPYGRPEDYSGGSIQRVDPATGTVSTVFTESGGHRLDGLNDIVFDGSGGCYVADTTVGIIHYAEPLTGRIGVAASELAGPNGVGLSPDGTRLYVSETFSGRVRSWEVTGPGELAELPDLYTHPAPRDRRDFWDGLAVDGAGNVCVADLVISGITVIGADGVVRDQVSVPVHDPCVTNICFGGPRGDTAHISSGGRGIVYEVPWPWPGLKGHFQP